ncbi:MAG: phenylalanine--tRNA ligase subunit alpha [Rickettsiaceae bacterium]|nr:phenylalanine--tRNA ligase subunit alpha [Rickettsiaceae bacterium]
MLTSILNKAKEKISLATSIAILEEIRVEFVGKKGQITEQMRALSTLPQEEKKSFGEAVNEAKKAFEELFEEKRRILKNQALAQKIEEDRVDITLPARYVRSGSLHPVMQAQAELVEIFAYLGFEVKEGPSIETQWYNFTALNMDENHPARQSHDTFYIGRSSEPFVLRTHTSPVQIRTMEKSSPPLKFIAPGRTYRSDYDQTHTPMFHQTELLALDKNLSMRDLKYVIETFVTIFFEGQNPQVRLRPSFFPFTTPSAEVDVRFGDGNWLEILGCGMIHPNVLKNAGIDSDLYQGYASGLGVERVAMLKYGINDLRQFFDPDTRILSHYGFSSFDIPSIIGGLTR